jgi:uncharacterized membrane protein
MAFCPKCGSAVADGAGFCPGCGAPQGAAASAPGGAPSAAPVAVTGQSQMDEKVAGLLCYVVFWVTGLIFYFIDTRPYVRFHAAQSIVLFGGLTIIRIVFGIFLAFTFFAGGWSGLFMVSGILWLLYLAGLVLWVVLMIKAYQGERFRVPVAADLAEKIFGKA